MMGPTLSTLHTERLGFPVSVACEANEDVRLQLRLRI